MKKIGKQTIEFENQPCIISTASIVGPKESNGPLSKYFDKCLEDEFWGEKTWEKAESKIIKEASNTAVSKANLSFSNIDYCFAGDLLNQCISSTFGLRDSNIPFIGLFGACSTFVEGLINASVFIGSNAGEKALCAVSSHFCSAEKQFRFPLELGNQRPPTSQWTVTGAGATAGVTGVTSGVGTTTGVSGVVVGTTVGSGVGTLADISLLLLSILFTNLDSSSFIFNHFLFYI